MQTYLLGVKQMAWVTSTGQYSTDIKTAQVFDLNAAIERCKKHKAASNLLVPVPVEWMNAI